MDTPANIAGSQPTQLIMFSQSKITLTKRLAISTF
jgi:hypothetical protein